MCGVTKQKPKMYRNNTCEHVKLHQKTQKEVLDLRAMEQNGISFSTRLQEAGRIVIEPWVAQERPLDCSLAYKILQR
jgi:hypothetical protein